MRGLKGIDYVLAKLAFMRAERIWPNGLRYLWTDAFGLVSREPYLPEMRFAFTNYGVSVGLQAADAMPDRVERLNAYFETYRAGDDYDRAAITYVMACNSHFPGLLLAP